MKNKIKSILSVFLVVCIAVFGIGGMSGCGMDDTETANTAKSSTLSSSKLIEESKKSGTKSTTEKTTGSTTDSKTNKGKAAVSTSVKIDEIPAYSSSPYVAINNNIPTFKSSELTVKSYEYYSPLDSLGRCGTAVACVGKDLMPTEERGTIGQVKPTGWHTVKYDCVDGKYLYNRCHLIGYQLSGENANERNLITGTRYMNVQGMLPFENMVADYVKETGNHVMYRVTPVFEGNNLLAKGVKMEAYSVEDKGDGICFNVFCYNVQPGIYIDYATGDSHLVESATAAAHVSSKEYTATKAYTSAAYTNTNVSGTYILNTNTKKFHRTNCSSVKRMSESNKESYSGSKDALISKGYSPCKNCNP